MTTILRGHRLAMATMTRQTGLFYPSQTGSLGSADTTSDGKTGAGTKKRGRRSLGTANTTSGGKTGAEG